MTDIWITPDQQPENADTIYHLAPQKKCGGFRISSWTYRGIDDPKIWLHFWCKDHMCPGMRVYVPRSTLELTVDVLSTILFTFE